MIKLILFDKDGTLLDLDAFWGGVARHAVREMLQKLAAPAVLEEPLLQAIGVQGSRVDVTGGLCYGTFAELADTLCRTLQAHGVSCGGEDFTAMTLAAFYNNADTAPVLPACEDMAAVLAGYRAQGRTLAVVTADDPHMTEHCLQALHIRPLFAAVQTDDGIVPPKPDPSGLHRLRQQFGVQKEETVMVGDSLTDLRFARNGGVRAIGIAKTEENKAVLAPLADAIVPDISFVGEVLARWEAAEE